MRINLNIIFFISCAITFDVCASHEPQSDPIIKQLKTLVGTVGLSLANNASGLFSSQENITRDMDAVINLVQVADNLGTLGEMQDVLREKKKLFAQKSWFSTDRYCNMQCCNFFTLCEENCATRMATLASPDVLASEICREPRVNFHSLVMVAQGVQKGHIRYCDTAVQRKARVGEYVSTCLCIGEKKGLIEYPYGEVELQYEKDVNDYSHEDRQRDITIDLEIERAIQHQIERYKKSFWKKNCFDVDFLEAVYDALSERNTAIKSGKKCYFKAGFSFDTDLTKIQDQIARIKKNRDFLVDSGLDIQLTRIHRLENMDIFKQFLVYQQKCLAGQRKIVGDKENMSVHQQELLAHINNSCTASIRNCEDSMVYNQAMMNDFVSNLVAYDASYNASNADIDDDLCEKRKNSDMKKLIAMSLLRIRALLGNRQDWLSPEVHTAIDGMAAKYPWF